jgi:hypothetical protein
VSVIDKSSPELEAILRGLELEVTIGIHAEDGAEGHDGGLTTAEVGSYHEFGLGVPQRSFVRAYFDEHASEIEQAQDACLARILAGSDPRAEAARLGLKLEGGMKERILARIDPPLAESTKARRGESAVPLVDTSQLIGAIRSRVTERRRR